MTFFLHVPELQEGIAEAQSAIGAVDEAKGEEERVKLVAMLDDMLSFAETNLESMLNLMGFSSIDELNDALQNYNNLNFSLQQIFSGFSAPQLTEVLASSGIGLETQNADYGLVISALEDTIRNRFPQFIEGEFLNGNMQNELREILDNSDAADKIAGDMAARLFGGLPDIDAILDLNNGTFSFMGNVAKLGNIINKNAKLKGVSGTSASGTLSPFYKLLLVPFFDTIINEKLDLFVDQDSYSLLEEALKRSQDTRFKRAIITERIKRGGITVSPKIKTTVTGGEDNIIVTSYLESLQVNVPKNLFNLSERGDKSIEAYVKEVCDKYPDVKEQITKNIKSFYWQKITQYIPTSIKNPLPYDTFSEIIDNMVNDKDGNIGWFFSQGTTKAGGAGMFGEIAGMIYMSILCPKLQSNARFSWAGGVTGDAKPPADIILGNELKKYGIQIKNYTSGSTLSHEYSLRIKNIVDNAAKNNSGNRLDLMTIQATSELGITEDEIEAVQNVIIANTFNVPYEKRGNMFVPGNPAAFTGPRAELDAVFQQATRYMAIISVIMHRLQYSEEITRQVSATASERQLQNTLWLINGSMFVSSVQILNELKNYVLDSINDFFNVSASVKIQKKKDLPEGIEAGKMTIIEYYNYSAKGLGKTSLSYVSAKIGTNYHMSAFNR